MLSQEQNDLITRIGPGTAAGGLLRRYWQPAALVDELSGTNRPIKPVKLMGESLVLFRDDKGRYGLIERGCPHRGTDLAYGRLEDGGLRCAFHGWLFDVNGQCLETPAEPDGSNLCANIRQKAYPVVEKSGILFAYMGPGEPPAFPHFDCFVAPDSHTFAFKGLIDCNWLQSLEVGIDPAHTSFLHRFFHDEDPKEGYGKLFRDTSIDSEMPMTKIMREFPRPRIEVEPTEYGFRIVTLRQISDTNSHVRVTNLMFPNAFIIPMSREMTITQWHVPIDDTQALLVRDLHELRRAGEQGRDAPPAAGALRTARLHPAQEQDQRLRLRSARAGARHLHRHGRRHQRARPVGLRVDGRDPGPHPRASRPVRQGDHRLSPPAAPGDRGHQERRQAADGARSRSRRRRITGPAAIDGIGPTDDWQGYWQTDATKRWAKRQGGASKRMALQSWRGWTPLISTRCFANRPPSCGADSEACRCRLDR